MKKEIIIHTSFLISFFIFVSLFKGWVDISFWPLWLGGLIGTILPDLDHVIYVYFLKPHELTSQRIGYMMGKRDILRSIKLLAETRSERTKLIFHTASFQLIFLVLTFLVITSSANLMGRGLVLAFLLHLLVDQMVDLVETGNLDNWFRQFPDVLNEGLKKGYLYMMLFLLLVFGFLL